MGKSSTGELDLAPFISDSVSDYAQIPCYCGQYEWTVLYQPEFLKELSFELTTVFIEIDTEKVVE